MSDISPEVITDLRKKSKVIVDKWKDLLQKESGNNCCVSEDSVRAFTVFLQLFLTRLEYGFFEEHLVYLDKTLRERLRSGEPHEVMFTELVFLKKVLFSVAATQNEPDSIIRLVQALDSVFCECCGCILKVHSELADREKSESLSDYRRWNYNLVNMMPIPVLAVDSGGKIKRVNEAWCSAVDGYESLFIGKEAEEFFDQSVLSPMNEVLKKSVKDERAGFTCFSSNNGLPDALSYEWRAIKEEGRTVGAALIAIPPGLKQRPNGNDSRIRDILSGKASFSSLMRKLRKDRNIPVSHLARRAGRARGYISSIESGKVIPSFSVMAAIADILDPDKDEDLLLAGIVTKIPFDIRRQLPWF